MFRETYSERKTRMIFRASFYPPGIYMLGNDFIRIFPLIFFFFFFLIAPHGMWDLSSLCMCTKLLQLCLILCNPMDHSPPGSSVLGILQARILEWVALPSSRGSSLPRDQIHSPCIESAESQPLDCQGSPPLVSFI